LQERNDSAEEQFLEQTAWANPQHPAHNNAAIINFHSQPSQFFVTPAQQKRYADSNVINGSASTIEMASNPPSSAAQAGPSTETYNAIYDMSSETPVPASRARHRGKGVDRIQTIHTSSGTSQQSTAHPPASISGLAGPPEAVEPPVLQFYRKPMTAEALGSTTGKQPAISTGGRWRGL
jgi:hypothetical protein